MPDPRARIVLTLGYIGTVLAAPEAPWPRWLALSALLVATVYFWRVPVRTLGLRLIPVTGLLVAALAGMLFGASKGYALALAMRLLLISMAGVTLGLSSSPTELLSGMRSLGVPSTLVSMLLLTVRYAHVLGEEVLRVSMAWRARATGPFGWNQALALGHAGAALAHRVSLRSERLAWAMVSRGFRGQLPTRPLGRPSLGSVVATVGGLLVLAALVWL